MDYMTIDAKLQITLRARELENRPSSFSECSVLSLHYVTWFFSIFQCLHSENRICNVSCQLKETVSSEEKNTIVECLHLIWFELFKNIIVTSSSD